MKRWSVRFLVAMCVVILALSVTTPHAFAATKHGCAPSIPPPVSGTLVQPPAIEGILFINEVLSTPNSLWKCSESGSPSQTNDTWVEIYNAQDQPFDLYAVHTSLDSGPNTNLFHFPFGSAIAPHGFLVVFPLSPQNTEVTTLRLILGSVVVDQITTPSLGLDQSYARTPDGTNTWQITDSPTIDASNNPILVTPTPTPTQKKSNDGGSKQSNTGGSSTDTTGRTNRPTLINGVQPTWGALRFPPKASSPLAVPTPTVISASPSPVSDNMDIPRKILLTVIVTALAMVLIWCWRLFTFP